MRWGRGLVLIVVLVTNIIINIRLLEGSLLPVKLIKKIIEELNVEGALKGIKKVLDPEVSKKAGEPTQPPTAVEKDKKFDSPVNSEKMVLKSINLHTLFKQHLKTVDAYISVLIVFFTCFSCFIPSNFDLILFM